MNKNFEQWADEVAASDVDLSTPPVEVVAPGNPTTENGASEKVSEEIDAPDAVEEEEN